MAEIKISELASATTPLGGTEVVPIVQGGVTKKVAVSSIGGGGGGTSLTTPYYFNLINNITPLSSVPTTNASQSLLFSGWNGTTLTILNVATSISVPGTTKIPSGVWQFKLYMYAMSANNFWSMNGQIYKRDSAGNETLITQLGLNINQMATSMTLYSWNINFPETTLLPTDRIVVKVTALNTGTNYQYGYIGVEGINYSHIVTTMNQAVTPIKTVNGNPLYGNGNIFINPARTRAIYTGQNSTLFYIGQITAMQNPINLDMQCETFGGSGTLTIYRSYNNNSVSAGAIVAASYSFTSAVRSVRFKRLIRILYESGTGEDYYWERGTMYLVTGNHYSDEVPSNHVVSPQEIMFYDSNYGPTSYPTYLIATTNSSAYIMNTIIEQGN